MGGWEAAPSPPFLIHLPASLYTDKAAGSEPFEGPSILLFFKALLVRGRQRIVN